MKTFKVFKARHKYTLVLANKWEISLDGTARFYVGDEVISEFDRNQWFFVEVI